MGLIAISIHFNPFQERLKKSEIQMAGDAPNIEYIFRYWIAKYGQISTSQHTHTHTMHKDYRDFQCKQCKVVLIIKTGREREEVEY